MPNNAIAVKMANNAQASHVSCEHGLLKGKGHEALRPEVIYLVRLYVIYHMSKLSRICQISIMKIKLCSRNMRVNV